MLFKSPIIAFLGVCSLSLFSDGSMGVFAATPDTPVEMVGAMNAPVLDIDSYGLRVRVLGLNKENHRDGKEVIELQSSLTEDKTVTPPLIDDFSFFLKQRLLDLGYPEATVDWQIQEGMGILTVKEGPRYSVGEIHYSYVGDESELEGEFNEYLLRPTHEKLGSSTNHPPFIKAAINSGANLVQRFLQSRGYMDAAVDEPSFTMQPATATVDVSVRIKIGLRYDIGAISIEGDLLKKDREVNDQVKELTGQPYSEPQLEAARTAIMGIYQQMGYFQVQVFWQTDIARIHGGAVPVRYRVEPGLRFRIARIEVADSFSKGAKRLIRSGFKRSVGTVYSPSYLEVIHRQLLDTEVFSKLDLEPLAEDGDLLVLQLSGEEAPRKRLSLYGGYQSFVGGIVGMELRGVNVFDTGHSAQIKAEFNGLGYSGAVQWLNPALFNTGWSFGTDVVAEAYGYFDYTTRTIAARPTFRRQWTKNITTSFFGSLAVFVTDSPTLTPAELGPDTYYVPSLGTSLVVDFRNSPVAPTDGWYASGTLSGGQIKSDYLDTNFLKTDLVFSWYQPLTKKIRLAATAHTIAMATGEDAMELPIDMRLFNGGANSVRSFPEREMGIKSKSGTPLGGTLSQVFSVEISYALSPNFEFALFGDAGSLSTTENDVFALPDDLRYAVGVGLRYKLPIGPLRVDYGYNPDRKEGEPAGALHITFGFAF